jgi:hypothetical protein
MKDKETPTFCCRARGLITQRTECKNSLIADSQNQSKTATLLLDFADFSCLLITLKVDCMATE